LNLEKLASMTPEQLMEIPGIGEKMVDKIYQAVNRFMKAATPRLRRWKPRTKTGKRPRRRSFSRNSHGNGSGGIRRKPGRSRKRAGNFSNNGIRFGD